MKFKFYPEQPVRVFYQGQIYDAKVIKQELRPHPNFILRFFLKQPYYQIDLHPGTEDSSHVSDVYRRFNISEKSLEKIIKLAKEKK
jgi:hypothetical protein